jgi:PAS domain S-box-containing protein
MFFSVGAIIAMLYITKITEDMNSIIKMHQVEQLRRSLLISLQTVQSQLFTVNTPFSQDLNLIVQSGEILEETASKCTTCHHPPNLNNRIIAIQGLIKDYKNHLSFYITVRANEKRMNKLKLESVSIGNEIIARTERMSHSASESLEEMTNISRAKISHVKNILILTILVTLLLGILVAFNLIRFITNPIKKLLNATRLIDSGKIGTTIDYYDTTEFGELAENFNMMSIGLKNGYDNLQKEVSERKQTEDALRESKDKLKSVFNQMPDIFFRTDKDGLIIWATPSAAQILGYHSNKDLIGLTYKNLFPESEKRALLLNELSKKGNVANFEIEMFKRDRSTVIVSAKSHFYYNKSGEVAGVEGFCRDITEHKKREEEHQKMQKLESIGIMAGGIAHDFNNFLTTIILNIGLAKMLTGMKNSVSEILKDAEKACLHAKSLTTQLLTFSKGGAPIKKITHIEELLKDSVNFALRGSAVKCVFFIQNDLWPVEVDTGQLTQAVNNIVINAIQAMPNGGVIEVSAQNRTVDTKEESLLDAKDFIKISIVDQGIGIPKENITKIFDPYFTTTQKGSGLGLSSTFSIIKNHNGYINAESASGSGTTFNIYLPAAKGKLPDKDSQTDRISKKTGKILVMDDEAMIRGSISKMLQMLGYEVETAKEGTEALDLYIKAKTSANPFDAVIMDLTISGGLGGKDTIIRLLGIDSDAKAIAASGYSNDPIMANFEQYGFRGMITKPFKVENLSELLDKVIRE